MNTTYGFKKRRDLLVFFFLELSWDMKYKKENVGIKSRKVLWKIKFSAGYNYGKQNFSHDFQLPIVIFLLLLLLFW